MFPRSLAAIIVFSGLANTASAQVAMWQPDGVAVCGNPCRADLPKVIPDGSGGAYVAWRDTRDHPTTGNDIYIQRLTVLGTVHPGWPPTGVPVVTAMHSQTLKDMSPDGQGGALIVWEDFRDMETDLSVDVYCQRIQPDGSVAPGWMPGGTPACRWPGRQGTEVSVVPDGTGGAYVVWMDELERRTDPAQDVNGYAQHLTADGQIAPGWTERGLPVVVEVGYQNAGQRGRVVEDGIGGAIVAWDDCRTIPCATYAQRLLPDGSLADGWPTNGLLLVEGLDPEVVSVDGAGGFYVATSYLNEFLQTQDLILFRFTLDGTRVSGWPQGGLPLCCGRTDGSGGKTHAEPDGSGGILLSRSNSYGSGRDLYGFRAHADATLAPGWPFGGVLVNDPLQGNIGLDDQVGDGAGGLFLAWEFEDLVTGSSSRVLLQHISPLGQPVAGWPEFGIPVTSLRSQFEPKVTQDDDGGVIVVWLELGGTGSRRGLFAQRFVDDETVQTRPSIVSAEGNESGIRLLWYAKDARLLESSVYRRTESSTWKYLGIPEATGPDELRYDDVDALPGERYAYRLGYLDSGTESFTDEVWVEAATPLAFALNGFRPNPAVGLPVVSLTLAKSEPARLEVFDLRGRLVLRRDLNGLGAGRHTVSLDSGARLAPGVYVLRLTQGEHVAHVRGVVLD